MERTGLPPPYKLIDQNSPDLPNYQSNGQYFHNEKTSEKLSEKQEERSTIITHHLKHGETLVGLSLRYKVKTGEIRSLNRMATDNLAGYQKLFIPTSFPEKGEQPSKEFLEEKEQEIRLKRFQIITKCLDRVEAKYYLSSSQENLELAIETYLKDRQWELSNPKPSSSSYNSSKKPTFSFKF